MVRNRLLITGASGFIGRRILALHRAAENAETTRGAHAATHDDMYITDCEVDDGPVHVAKAHFDIIPIAHHAHEIAGYTVQPLDFTSLSDRELDAFMRETQATHLLHTAWYTGDGFYRSPENLSWLAHSARIFRAFLTAGSRAIASAGSCAEYAASNTAPIREAARTSDTTLYAAAKNAVRSAQFAACAEFGARSAWGRVSFVYGPDEPTRKLLRSTAESLCAERAVTVREPQKRADFLHAHDAARGLWLLATSDRAEGVFNIASGETPPLGELVLQLRDLCGSKSVVSMGDSTAPHMIVSSDRIRALGFKPEIPLRAGLAEMATSARQALLASANAT